MEEVVSESENKEGEVVVAGKVSSTREVVVEEVKRVCYIALPMVVVAVSQNLLRVVSMSIVGRVGELQLAGAALATSFANVSGYSLLFGLSCGLDTLCGQAYGAGQYKKLGIYAYSGIISLLLVCLPVSVLWIFMDKLFVVIGQDPLIAAEARRYSIWLIPSLFPYAILQILNRYLVAQSLVLPLLYSTVVVAMFHVPTCWALVFGLDKGIAGAAIAIGLSYTLNVILLVLYVKYSSACKKTHASFSNEVLTCIWEFFRFGFSSALMICLEWWCYEIIVLVSGLLRNPKLETSVITVSLMISTLHYFMPYAFGVAASTRVSNELGAGNPKAARMVVWIVMILGMGEAIIASAILLSSRSIVGKACTNAKEVVDLVKKMTPLISITLIVDACSALLCGVARGSGWQHIGAYVSLGAYYLAGLPMALVLGFVLHLRVKGFWIGLIVGVSVQSILLALVTCFADWKKQAAKARERIFEGSIPDKEQVLSSLECTKTTAATT